MTDESMEYTQSARIKVIGVGGGGTNAVSTMIKAGIEGVGFVAANTDIQSLQFSLAAGKIQLGKELTKGLGAGANPDIGRDAALEDRHELQEILAGSDMVFITAGMGGGTGTGGAAVVSQIAREQGALTVGVVTRPFAFEGKRRQRHAQAGIDRLREHVDTLIVIPNDRLLSISTPDLSMVDAFRMADNVLVNAVRGISDIINIPGMINVDFADVKSIMVSMGQALMGVGEASGPGRAKEAATTAISSPLLEDIDIEGATGILINITSGGSLGLMEVNEACTTIQAAAHEDANIIFGAVVDETFGDTIRVTVIATGFPVEDELTKETPKKLSSRTVEPFHSQRPGAISRAPVQAQTQTPVPTPYIPAETVQAAVDSEPQSYIPEPATLSAPIRNPFDSFTEDASPGAAAPTEIESLAMMTLERADHFPETEEKANEEKLAFDENDKQDDSSELSQEESSTQEPEQITRAGGHIEYVANEQDVTNDIDKKIDEALEMADRLRGLNTEDDELEIPTFLRNQKHEPTL